MSKKLLFDVHPERTKMALVEGGELIEIHIERSKTVNIVGNIYRGRVVNLLSGMQAAFVNIGLEKNAFLYVGDMMVDKSELVSGEAMDFPQQLSVKEGDSIMVQVVKEQIGTKGARVSHSISLPGRLLVLMPFVNYIGVSKKIVDESQRERLFRQVSRLKPEGMGFIVRTAAANATQKSIENDARALLNLWMEISQRNKAAADFEVLHFESDLIARTFRDVYTDEVTEIVVNDEKAHQRIASILKRLMPRGRKNVVMFPRCRDMFFDYGISEQIDNMLSHKTWLKSGAYLIIDKTEALTVIDVNTGKYVGDSTLEDTVYNTNLLAAEEIAKQIRLRNIGGIIVCDFIDMDSEEHRRAVLERLDMCLKKDRIKSTVVGMSGLGLVEITRKKTRNEVTGTLTQSCPYCNGDGYIHSLEHTVNKIFVAIINGLASGGVTGVLVTANSQVTDYIFRNRIFNQIKNFGWEDYRIYFSTDFSLHMEKFRVKEFYTNELDLPQNARLLTF